jgi:hypothetical protein
MRYQPGGLTDGALADIRRHRDIARQNVYWLPHVTVDRYDGDVSVLLAEVDRLRRFEADVLGPDPDAMSVGDGIQSAYSDRGAG